jgi:ArsR family transcriptional regulator, arsenate/arsenite/antimonite-responsive transcriptional repressor
MAKSQAELNLEARANLFKALGHPTRLLMVNLIKQKPRHTEELASILKLSAGTVSHHLSLLTEAGLLDSSKEQYYQNYSLKGGMLEKTLGEVVSMPQPGLDKNVSGDAYETKVLKTFFKRGRLIKIPAQRKKLLVILEELVKAFELSRSYTEREVSIILSEYHDDFATLRRGLVEVGLMTRKDSFYQRVETKPQSPL